MISVSNVVKSIDEHSILNGISCRFEQGLMYGLIGPNGAGKSTLLSILSGVEPFESGEVSLKGLPIAHYSRRALAKWLAVLQQEGLPNTSFTVRDVVAMGRYPFQNWLGDEDLDAEQAVDYALQAMELGALENRRLNQLSGGERQRVALAKVMAQQPQVIFLDEPTTFLDIGYQVQLLDTVRQWQITKGLTVIAVLHDLNLAALYCDRLLVLHNGKLDGQGTPAEVITEQRIKRVYGTDAAVMLHPATGRPQVLLMPNYSEKLRR